MGLEHQHAGQAAHPVDIGQPRSGAPSAPGFGVLGCGLGGCSHELFEVCRISLFPAQVKRDFATLDYYSYFCKYRNMTSIQAKKSAEHVAKYADMFSAMATEARLRIMQLLLSAHPDGLVVNEIQEELEIPNSTLSHHLDKLKNEDLVRVRREGTFLHYTANTEALQELLRFLYAECCTRNKAVEPKAIIQVCR